MNQCFTSFAFKYGWSREALMWVKLNLFLLGVCKTAPTTVHSGIILAALNGSNITCNWLIALLRVLRYQEFAIYTSYYLSVHLQTAATIYESECITLRNSWAVLNLQGSGTSITEGGSRRAKSRILIATQCSPRVRGSMVLSMPSSSPNSLHNH